jgi:elongation factor P--(R)-beta-lysine ligase
VKDRRSESSGQNDRIILGGGDLGSGDVHGNNIGHGSEGVYAAGGSRADWQPTATLNSLRQRAAMLARLREFFSERGVLEVETPTLSTSAVSDPQIESLATQIAGMSGRFYLSTSPEYPMKRLLASGSGDIYQVCKVFRDEERGRWHNPEFTMIEWYRLGFDDAALMAEVEGLVASLLAPHRRLAPAERLTYAEGLRRHAGVEAHTDSEAVLERAAADHGIVCKAELDRDAKLDLLMGLVVGPKLGVDRPCFICDYPASQASLARLKPGLPAVAARFEFYIDGIELANGFHELVNADEQRGRFTRDSDTRRARGQVEPPVDERLLAALAAGMPDCAGVALGFDRLVAIALRAARLSEAMAFSIDNA